MFGLVLADPSQDPALRNEAAELMHRLEIPLSGFSDDASALFRDDMSQPSFLQCCVQALLTPGEAIPATLMLRQLSGDAYPGNVVRRYVFLQLSLLPYLRMHPGMTALDGAHLLGRDLLVAHYGPEGGLHCRLPEGEWLELYSGDVHQGILRQLCSINLPPVFVRANTLLPIGVNDRRTDGHDADRLTLHWYQPMGQASCILQTGERYDAQQLPDGRFDARSTSAYPWHLIVHQHGMEALIR